ncbi:Scr1 family TA system antitoxin-like transcriptional regulator [Streptomyces sp. DSM 40750]|uniref:Scr1 family TA system antitoxin-like transcriptional regulator n=1 Tax=Streptomyces sp. DSM 40750 TaxID=2801030 RepID=UPI00214BFB1A|nr:Scr1 family TA system antitoxin-like transcriptional regulator [Streptomyces sp. DSM 40750]UUU23910.1 Scr1 family TA system antitoxin-like transcriptional regulator [Streptomyces sp. DSM 40750]
MAARKPPTERQRRLGAELRKMREQVGLSLTGAAALHGTDKTTISNTESGRFGVSADRVRVWAGNYSCPDGKYVDSLAEMARERRVGGAHWWDEYRDLLTPTALDLAELEHHAVALRGVQITHFPGLLQYEDYIRAIFRESVPPLPPEDVDRRVAFRMRRRDLLDRPRPPECTFLIHEAALCMRFGPDSVVRSQLEHVLKWSERESVTIRVIPFAAGSYPSSGSSSTLYAHGPVPQLDTVQIDAPTGSTFLYSDTHLASYRTVVERMEQLALGPDASRDLIRETLRRL